MQGKDILRLKRSANQITSDKDLTKTDDILMDLSQKIFIHNYTKKYNVSDVSLYQTGILKHPQNSSLTVTPHFVRDDGTVIFLELINNGTSLNSISEEDVHLAMEILNAKHASIFSIILSNDFNINNMNLFYPYETIYKYYSSIKERTLKYVPEIVKKYISTFNTKKLKIIDTPNNDIVETTTQNNVIIKDFNRNDWVSASKTRNYALKDTLIDWLDFYHKNNDSLMFETTIPQMTNNKFTHKRKILPTTLPTTLTPPTQTTTVTTTVTPTLTLTSNEYDFPKFIMSKGIQFENKVINLIKQKVKPEEFVVICNDMRNYDSKVLEYEKNSIDEIMKGTPVIYQPVLMNRTGVLAYSYGLPDLLIRSDYLCKIMKLDPLDKNMKTHKAPKLNGNYHYVVVDVKFTSLELCSDGKRIRNSGSMPAYKCQLYIYNHALGHVQGYEPTESYVLGRKYKYESKKKHYSENNCFTRLGHIQYDQWDNEYIKECIEAINWIKNLRANGKKWTLFPKPSVTELYPNMSSPFDTQWDKFKFDYANKIGEITLLWNCGVKNREIAHKNGIYSYRDPNCNSITVGLNGPKQGPIIDKIIGINQKCKFSSDNDRIFMNINTHIDNRWIKPCELKISVDFETINCVFDDFKTLPVGQDQNYLFMIGVAYQVGMTNIEYKMFIISELSKDAEFQIIYQFYKFLRELTDKYLGSDANIPLLYHWGHIERSFFTGLCDRLNKKIGVDVHNDIKLMKTDLEWYDLCESFKNNPIVINGCFKFGLKEIAGRMSELGLIESKWENTGSSCSNGNTAMVMAHKAYQISKESNTLIVESAIMKEIMAYNRIDCIVIHEIINFMRKKATADGLIYK